MKVYPKYILLSKENQKPSVFFTPSKSSLIFLFEKDKIDIYSILSFFIISLVPSGTRGLFAHHPPSQSYADPLDGSRFSGKTQELVCYAPRLPTK